MKKIIPVFLILLIFASCKKSFLNLAPPSVPTEGLFYKTATDAITAINGCYADLRASGFTTTTPYTLISGSYSGPFQVLMENRADNIIDDDAGSNSGTNFKIARFTDDPGNPLLYTTWDGIYFGIAHCNTLLTKIDGINMDNSLKNRIKAEASFLRALHYFNLVRLWGPVPVNTSILSLDEAYNLKRDDVATVYAQIETDLNFAAANLPMSYSGADLGRATSAAANGLLGKVYLYEKKYSNANTVLQAVINAPAYSLLPNIADVFSASRKYNSEILFAVRYASGVLNQTHTYWYSNSTYNMVNPSIQNAYTAGDTRKALTDAVTIAGTTSLSPRKFADAPDANNASGSDFPVLRLADVYLMQAEVLNETEYNASTDAGTAFYYLNAIRSRAGLSKLTAANLPDQASFRQEVYTQRRLELPFECDRWFDLVRTGQAINAIKADTRKGSITIPSYRFIYPIPQQELTIMNNPTNFPQNTGY